MKIHHIFLLVLVAFATMGPISTHSPKPYTPTLSPNEQSLVKQEKDLPITHYNVMIYPDSFQAVAEEFKEFHRTYEQADTLLVPLSVIRAKGRTSTLKPKEDGWENMRPKLNEIKNYDYDLALMITDYIEDLTKQQKVDSITILGNAALVPPSYYYYIDYEHDLEAPEDIKEYTSWIASDKRYSNPISGQEYTRVTGRISVQTPQEVKDYIQDLRNFKLVHQISPNHHCIYSGSNVGHNRVYMGEMFYLALQERKLFGDDVSFYFESDSTFLKDHQIKALSEENALFHWIFSHGMGGGLVMSDNQQITVGDMLRLPAKKYMPIILSPSCLDAGFDYELIPLPFDRDEKISVGEAVLASKGCGIGYMGSSRLALAGLDFKTDPKTGKVQIKDVRYMPDLLLDFLEAYHQGNVRIADALRIARNQHIKEHRDHTDPGYKAMNANFIFIGDPVLTLPSPPPFTEAKHDAVTFLNSGQSETLDTDFEIPSFTTSAHRLAQVPLVQFILSKNNKELDEATYTIVNATTQEKVVDNQPLRSSIFMQFKPEPGNLYILKTKTLNNRFTWQYFYVRDPS